MLPKTHKPVVILNQGELRQNYENIDGKFELIEHDDLNEHLERSRSKEKKAILVMNDSV